MPTLTVAIIAFNEEANLRELLPQLAWADEVVVVDGGSTDKTVQVATAHHCRVLKRRFDNYAAQRNHATQNSQSDWVLMLDADERPTSRMVREVSAAIASENFDAYRTPIRSHIFDHPMRFSGTQDDRPIRLVRRDLARWRGEVHEVCEVNGRVGTLQSALEHYTLPDLGAFLEKMHRYTRLEAHARVQRGEAPRRQACWLAPPREFLRRFGWKLGILDGPAGWAFCALSALSAWVLEREHQRQWRSVVQPVHAWRFSPQGGQT